MFVFPSNFLAGRSARRTHHIVHLACQRFQQKVEITRRELRRDCGGLLEGDLPGAVAAEAEAGAAIIVGESFAVEGAGTLQTVEDDGGVIAEHFDLKLGPSGVMEFVAGREDDAQNRGAVEDLAVGRDVNVFGSHEPVHGGGVVFKPRRVPGFAELHDFFVQAFNVHNGPGHSKYRGEGNLTQEADSRSLELRPAPPETRGSKSARDSARDDNVKTQCPEAGINPHGAAATNDAWRASNV
jgi:hypothetical protein